MPTTNLAIVNYSAKDITLVLGLADCYEALEETDKLAALKTQWGVDDQDGNKEAEKSPG